MNPVPRRVVLDGAIYAPEAVDDARVAFRDSCDVKSMPCEIGTTLTIEVRIDSAATVVDELLNHILRVSIERYFAGRGLEAL